MKIAQFEAAALRLSMEPQEVRLTHGHVHWMVCHRKGKRQGREPYVPYYTTEDAERILKQFVEMEYNTVYEVSPGIKVRFNDVGHLLGSSAIEVWVTEGEETAELAKVIQRTFDRGGNVVVPSFAVGRTQEMLYFIRQIKEAHMIEGHDGFKVYMDSPLALKATEIFNEHTADCFDDEAKELVMKGINPISFPGLCLATTADESRAINFDMEPKVIISASGMCDAGRIKHHLKHNLWREECTILFVGYQAEGTLGRRLLDGVEEVKLFNEPITVEAEIVSLQGISGHADREGLVDWAAGFECKPRRCFIVHGDDSVVDGFAELLHEELGWDATAPYSGTVYDLTTNTCLLETHGVPAERKAEKAGSSESAKATPYVRLEKTGERLMAIIRQNRKLSNKDLAKFADQLNALCDKWMR